MQMRFTDEQVITILREVEAGTMQIKTLCKKHNITEQTFSAGSTSSVWRCPMHAGQGSEGGERPSRCW